jgi:hypothetical protein
MYIKLPMYLFFYMAIILNIVMWSNALLGALEGRGPENLNFLGPSDAHFALCHFMAQKRIDLRGPSQLFWAQMALALLVAILEHKKVLISRPTPSNHYAPRHIKNRYIKGTVNDLGGGM